MEGERFGIASCCESVQKRAERQPGIVELANPPANDLSGEQVNDDADVELLVFVPDFRDIRDPDYIWGRRIEFLVY